MNYRHAYHAGNFADVLKHAVLALVIEHLKRKPTPFRVIDTHAGAGLYSLTAREAGKTGEWQDGIGRVMSAYATPGQAGQALHAGPELTALLEPYLGVVRRLNSEGALALYPGSPVIADALIRSGDHLIANELHPVDRESLEEALAGSPNAKVLSLDGWNALKSLLPPRERRGVVLVDPPFEVPGELHRMVEGVKAAVRRFASGVYLLWYPIKDQADISALHGELGALRLPKLLAAELFIHPPDRADRLNGCGLVIVNAPFGLAETLAAALPELARLLARSPGAHGRLLELGA
ncbi:MAG: 23S rRNA (adenine(2030)-N(6))-methyltransferase RlmJ [Hyphomicrobiaceae bacterium]|nr:23S rRNA (adenine(2030)-N(6))-methyltransferase RlmJ [Hyphomicrobiaceae bacterium]